MNEKRAKELLPIIEAFASGKKIEYSEDNSKWYGASTPSWDDKRFYRIKPEPKLVPFTFEDNLLFRDKWVRSKGLTALSRISWFGPDRIALGNLDYTYRELLYNYEFEDKSPCGKYINE
jgi:hypothetical protein